MAHSHHDSSQGLKTAFWLNTCFVLIELIGGIFTNSVAILTDAIHDLGDSLAIATSIYLEKVAQKPKNKTFSYGYQRFSLLSALGLSLMLLGGAVFMFVKALSAVLHPQVVDSSGMLGLSVLGIAMNGWAVLKMKHQENGHQHNHNSKAVMLHLLEDVLGWIAILVGSVVIYFTHWYWIDGLLSVAIALYIAYNALSNLKPVFMILLQATPPELDLEKISAEIMAFAPIKSIHHLHLWQLTESTYVLSAHLVVNDMPLHEASHLREDIEQLLAKHHIFHTTIQFDLAAHACESRLESAQEHEAHAHHEHHHH